MKEYLVKMPLELHSKLKILSVKTNKSMRTFIVEAIYEKLEKEEGIK